MKILFFFLVAIVIYGFSIFVESIIARKANYDCTKCKNFMCNAHNCEQLRRKK